MLSLEYIPYHCGWYFSCYRLRRYGVSVAEHHRAALGSVECRLAVSSILLLFHNGLLAINYHDTFMTTVNLLSGKVVLGSVG